MREKPDYCPEFDEEGNLVDEDGNIIDEEGRPLDEDGNPIAKEDRKAKHGRPVVEPQWFTNIRGQTVFLDNGDDLDYAMGNPVNVYSEKMTVSVDFYDLNDSKAIQYDNMTNSIKVDHSKL